MGHTSNDIRFELMAIIYNIGALHSYLGAEDARSGSEGMKLACTHFQCAAWAFQVRHFQVLIIWHDEFNEKLKKNYPQILLHPLNWMWFHICNNSTTNDAN